MVGTSH